jgi:hypothetical protein
VNSAEEGSRDAERNSSREREVQRETQQHLMGPGTELWGFLYQDQEWSSATRSAVHPRKAVAWVRL